MANRVFFIHALSPLHAGTGQGSGVIDLPIAREKATRLPIVPGSSVKGVLRAAQWEKTQNGDRNKVLAAYGPDTDNASEYAGAVSFGDARLLCLPVRSLHGVFAWVTSPLALDRYRRDADLNLTPPSLDDEGNALAANGSDVTYGDKLYLEDLDLSCRESEEAGKWAEELAKRLFPKEADPWREHFSKRFVILHDDAFSFLYETALEVNARIRISDESKTVERGALWYEEALPAESILWGTAFAQAAPYNRRKTKIEGFDEAENVLKFVFDGVENTMMQMGGKATVGRGQVRFLKG